MCLRVLHGGGLHLRVVSVAGRVLCRFVRRCCADDWCRITYCILSGLCLLTGAMTTHGLGGALRHKVFALPYVLMQSWVGPFGNFVLSKSLLHIAVSF